MYGDLAHALARSAVAAGWNLAFAPLLGGALDWERRLRQQDADALVVLEPIPTGIAGLLERLARPAVVVNSLTAAPVPHLLPDEAGNARRLVAHLRELGHRRIAYMSIPREGRHSSEAERRDGVLAAAAAEGLACETVIAPEAAAARRLAAGPATGVIAYNPADALHLLAGLTAAGVAVPGRLSLCCWDDDEALRWSAPPLTSLVPPVEALAAAAIACLIDMVEGRLEPPRRREVQRFPGRVAVRASTAPPLSPRR